MHFDLGQVRDKANAVNSMDIWYRAGATNLSLALSVIHTMFSTNPREYR